MTLTLTLINSGKELGLNKSNWGMGVEVIQCGRTPQSPSHLAIPTAVLFVVVC